MRFKATRKWSIVDVKFDLSAEDDREQDWKKMYFNNSKLFLRYIGKILNNKNTQEKMLMELSQSRLEKKLEALKISSINLRKILKNTILCGWCKKSAI